MVRKYIIDNTKYPRATGGTPITTWLPNQMGASLEFCQQLITHVKEDQLSSSLKEDYQMRRGLIESQINKLLKEVSDYQEEFAKA
jgi:indoleamine 2,3-dioxygenase